MARRLDCSDTVHRAGDTFYNLCNTYFHLGGPKFRVTGKEGKIYKVTAVDSHVSCPAKFIKKLSYFTLLPVIIFGIGYGIQRCLNTYEIDAPRPPAAHAQPRHTPAQNQRPPLPFKAAPIAPPAAPKPATANLAPSSSSSSSSSSLANKQVTFSTTTTPATSVIPVEPVTSSSSPPSSVKVKTPPASASTSALPVLQSTVATVATPKLNTPPPPAPSSSVSLVKAPTTSQSNSPVLQNFDQDKHVLAFLLEKDVNVAVINPNPFTFEVANTLYCLWSYKQGNQITIQAATNFYSKKQEEAATNKLRVKLHPETKQIISVQVNGGEIRQTNVIPEEFKGWLTNAFYGLQQNSNSVLGTAPASPAVTTSPPSASTSALTPASTTSSSTITSSSEGTTATANINYLILCLHISDYLAYKVIEVQTANGKYTIDRVARDGFTVKGNNKKIGVFFSETENTGMNKKLDNNNVNRVELNGAVLSGSDPRVPDLLKEFKEVASLIKTKIESEPIQYKGNVLSEATKPPVGPSIPNSTVSQEETKEAAAHLSAPSTSTSGSAIATATTLDLSNLRKLSFQGKPKSLKLKHPKTELIQDFTMTEELKGLFCLKAKDNSYMITYNIDHDTKQVLDVYLDGVHYKKRVPNLEEIRFLVSVYCQVCNVTVTAECLTDTYLNSLIYVPPVKVEISYKVSEADKITFKACIKLLQRLKPSLLNAPRVRVENTEYTFESIHGNLRITCTDYTHTYCLDSEANEMSLAKGQSGYKAIDHIQFTVLMYICRQAMPKIEYYLRLAEDSQDVPIAVAPSTAVVSTLAQQTLSSASSMASSSASSSSSSSSASASVSKVTKTVESTFKPPVLLEPEVHTEEEEKKVASYADLDPQLQIEIDFTSPRDELSPEKIGIIRDCIRVMQRVRVHVHQSARLLVTMLKPDTFVIRNEVSEQELTVTIADSGITFALNNQPAAATLPGVCEGWLSAVFTAFNFKFNSFIQEPGAFKKFQEMSAASATNGASMLNQIEAPTVQTVIVEIGEPGGASYSHSEHDLTAQEMFYILDNLKPQIVKGESKAVSFLYKEQTYRAWLNQEDRSVFNIQLDSNFKNARNGKLKKLKQSEISKQKFGVKFNRYSQQVVSIFYEGVQSGIALNPHNTGLIKALCEELKSIAEADVESERKEQLSLFSKDAEDFVLLTTVLKKSFAKKESPDSFTLKDSKGNLKNYTMWYEKSQDQPGIIYIQTLDDFLHRPTYRYGLKLDANEYVVDFLYKDVSIKTLPTEIMAAVRTSFKRVLHNSAKYYQRGSAIEIRVVQRALSVIPAQHLRSFVTQLEAFKRTLKRMPSVHVRFLQLDLKETIASDAGGVRRMCINSLASGLISCGAIATLDGQSRFHIPIARAFDYQKAKEITKVSLEEKAVYEDLGQLMMLCYRDPKLATGQHFYDRVFKACLSLKTAEIDQPFETLTFDTKLSMFKALVEKPRASNAPAPKQPWDVTHPEKYVSVLNAASMSQQDIETAIKELSDEKMGPLPIVLAAQHPENLEELQQFTKQLLIARMFQRTPGAAAESWKFENARLCLAILDAKTMSSMDLKMAQIALECAGLEDGTVIANLQQLQGHVKRLLVISPDWNTLPPIHSLAGGMKTNCHATSSTKEDNNKEWSEKFKGADHVHISTKIQGLIDRPTIVATMKITGIPFGAEKDAFNQKVEAIKEWILAPTTTEDQLGDFLKFVTGIEGTPQPLEIRYIYKDSPLPIAHTCFCQLDLNGKMEGLMNAKFTGTPKEIRQKFMDFLLPYMTGGQADVLNLM